MIKVSRQLRKLQHPQAAGDSGFLPLATLSVLCVQMFAAAVFLLLVLQKGYFGHHHPRLMQAVDVAVPILICWFCLSLFNMARQKRGLLRRPDLKLNHYLNYSFEKTYPVFAGEAFERLVDRLRAHTVKTPDTRLAFWELTSLSEPDNCAHFRLQYVRVPLGTKPWRLYPRTVDCTIRLLSTGISTIVNVSYHANSSMDYPIVCEIIDRTNEEIDRCMAEMSCVHELATIRSREKR